MFCSTVTSSAQLSAGKTKKGKRNAEERYVAVKNHVPSPRSVQVQTVARPWPHKRPAQEPWASKQVSNCLTERLFLCCITGALFSGQNNCPSKILCTPRLSVINRSYVRSLYTWVSVGGCALYMYVGSVQTVATNFCIGQYRQYCPHPTIHPIQIAFS